MKEALYIILGSLISILSPGIVARIEKHYKKDVLKKAIFSDLKNLAVRIVTVYHKLHVHFGTRNKEALEYVKSIYEKYRVDCPRDILDYIKKQIGTKDEDLERISTYYKAGENISLSFKKYSLAFIESTMRDISIFDPQFQREILEIRAQIDMLNEEIDHSRSFNQLLFNPTYESKSSIIKSNMDNSYKEIQKKCKFIVDRICDILEKAS